LDDDWKRLLETGRPTPAPMVLVFITGGETVKIDIKIDASWSQKFYGTNSLLVNE